MIAEFFNAHSVLLAVLIIGGIVLGILGLQKNLDEREIEQQTKQTEKFEREKKASEEQTQKLLELFEQQHGQTVSILDAIKDMNGSITLLAENDRRQDEKVNNLREEYLNARDPNSQPKKETSVINRARANRPLRQREDDVLSADAELYRSGRPNAK